MRHEDATSSLVSLGFRAIPGNDHVVAVGAGSISCGHEYYWQDLKNIGTAVVDLLRPLDGTIHEKPLDALIHQWNAAQVSRAYDMVAQVRVVDDAKRQRSCITHEEAFLTLIGLGFLAFPENEHGVAIGAGSTLFRHEYYVCDWERAGMAVVDLLRPLDTAAYDTPAELILTQWNAAQVHRANMLVDQARAVEDVMRWCS
jgi:hypothetical protein